MLKEKIKIKETLLISKDDILNKKYNLWMGLSFGNKWFTNDNIEKLIHFGLEHTKESLLIWIPGRLYVSNLRYFDNMSRAQSLKKSFEIEDEKNQEIKEIIKKIDLEKQKKIIIANYDDVLTPKMVKQREALMREFSKQEKFYDSVMEIADEMLESRGRTSSKDRAESVALYVLQELPIFLDSFSVIGNNETYSVILYPGLGKLDELVVQIIEDDRFQLLRDKLMLKNKTGIASVGIE